MCVGIEGGVRGYTGGVMDAVDSESGEGERDMGSGTCDGVRGNSDCVSLSVGGTRVGFGTTEPRLRSALVLNLVGGFENDFEGGRFLVCEP